MSEPLGHSVYLTEYKSTGRLPAAVKAAGGSPVFLSLHISEEYGENYASEIKKLCDKLHACKCRILADVSKDTLQQFHVDDFTQLSDMLGLWALRIDYGLSKNEIISLAEKMPVVLNASTTSYEDAMEIASAGKEVYAMHNFYPRVDTGLDREYLKQTTDMLHQAGMKVMAFIPGDLTKRGPIYEGLPTLECHRHMSPYLSYLDLVINFHMDVVFAADPELSSKEETLIRKYTQENIITVPCLLDEKYSSLYGKVFHNRIDSPSWLIRFQESRQYASQGKEKIAPESTARRVRGTITIDNELYQRYCGEVQMIVKDLPADHRVNIAGRVQREYLDAVDLIRRGEKLVLVHE